MRASRGCVFDGMNGRIVVLALIAATTLVLAACASGGSTSGFPTGRFVNEQYKYRVFEFDEGGTWRYFEGNLEVPSVQGTYGVEGNLYTELTHDYAPLPQIPATYTWTYDDQKLTFYLSGEDPLAHRKSCYDGQTYIKEE